MCLKAESVYRGEMNCLYTQSVSRNVIPPRRFKGYILKEIFDFEIMKVNILCYPSYSKNEKFNWYHVCSCRDVHIECEFSL